MGLLTIYRADNNAELANETRSSDPSATWISGTFNGWKTWNCANKMMPSNLVIGGKTLTCKNMMMKYNVKAYYRSGWKKYESVYGYAQVQTTVAGYADAFTWSFDGQTYVTYGVINSYTFNASTGTYSISAGSCNYQRLYHPESTYHQQISGNAFVTDRYSTAGTVTNTSAWAYKPASVFGTSSYLMFNEYKITSTAGCYKMTSTGSWGQGTYISDVVANSDSAYPTNGRHTDGYWYVKQY